MLLESEVGLTVVGEADTVDRLHEQLRAHRPDLILMTLSQRGFRKFIDRIPATTESKDEDHRHFPT